jgi:type I restriction enzyme R subunit
VVDVLRSQGVESLDEVEEAVQALADERVRAEFTVKLKQFAQSLDEVLPRPEGLEFTADAKKLSFIYAVARNRYKDTPDLGKDVGAKVRRLIDDHMISLGIDPKIPPVQLTDTEFAKHLNRQVSDRAKASEMEHAIRAHIRKHLDEDPVKYTRLSERLKELLNKLDGAWEAQVDAFAELIQELRDDQPVGDERLPDLPPHYLPFLRLLTQAKLGDDAQPDPATQALLVDATVELVETITGELRIPDFWKPAHIPDQERLKGRLFEELFNRRLLAMDRLDATVDKLMELARANHARLVRP